MEQAKRRCRWVNVKNPLSVKYHDHEWGNPHYDDKYLFEFLVLESFQAGLSWECVLNKREVLREAFDGFDYDQISRYDEEKINALCSYPNMIKNKLKIKAAVTNAKVFIEIQKEHGSFANYIWAFSDHKVIKNVDDQFHVTSALSDTVSKDLRKRGMKFVGSIIIYSYLQAIGMIDDHELGCDFYKRDGDEKG
ncbi:DNA-3-methyladenine glycosylase I [Massilicoli timonensis]|uniref:DNA-3-methyladenine glycosylase I n=1 Tax=Massilicoli timonensis TaxID=2015901 RepID=UPI000C835C07|nr:DNA-3-methyladenine glycosylase I [Massilicoli timonensis]